MDPKEYDRIADLLMQIRKKIDNLNTTDETSAIIKDIMLYHLHRCLATNDKIAECDAKGWL
jgi:hypothetical protein